MPNVQSEGSFELHFKAEKSFRIFMMEYAKCYSAMSVRGKLEKPTAESDRHCTIDFHLECKCSTVLKEFKLAYDKTFIKDTQPDMALLVDGDFVTEMRAALEVEDRDWVGRLLSCKL